MAKSKHDKVAEFLARKFDTEYKSDKGIDVVTAARAIEVEVKKESLNQGLNQIVRSSKARYLAVTPGIVKIALELTKGKGVGVMSSTGRIIKKAGRN